MRTIFIGLSLFLFFLPLQVYALDVQNGTLDATITSETYYQDIRGNEQKSMLKEGWMYHQDVEAEYTRTLGPNINMQAYSHARGSNDPQYQINERKAMFLQGYLRLYNDNYEFQGGDMAVDYTPYTLNTSLLGLKGSYQYQDMFKVSTLFGRNRDEGLDGYIRYTTGGRIEYFYKDYLTLGGTFVHTAVDGDSLEKEVYIGDQLNQVYGGDLNLKFWEERIVFRGEYARSAYNADTDDPRYSKDYADALLLEGSITPLSNLNLNGIFERVEPRFYSITGSSSADIQRLRGEVDYTPWPALNLLLSYEYSYDKLNDNSYAEERTYSHLYSGSTYITPFYQRTDFWNSLSLNIMLDYSEYKTKDEPQTMDQESFYGSASLSMSFQHFNYSLGYSYSRFWDNILSGADYYMYSPFANLGINYQWLKLNWNWSFNYSFENTKILDTEQVDKVHRGDAGLTLSYTPTESYLSLQASMEKYNNDSQSWMEDNLRHSFSARLDQTLKKWKYFVATLTASCSYSDYEEDNPDTSNYFYTFDENLDQDYSEIVSYVGLTLKF